MTTTDAEKRHWTQQELVDEARRLFGDDPKQWAFICPNCSDVACAADFIAIDADPQRVGQECIGRSLGALSSGSSSNDSGRSKAKRGCDWAAYGLFPGPWVVTVPTPDGDTKELFSFRLAPHRSRTAEPTEVPA